MDKLQIEEHVKKAIRTLRYRLLGAASQNREWYLAVDALEFAIANHEGTFRKDGVTPYIIHPVEAANYALTLSNVIRPVQLIGVLLMHDLMEDEDVRYATMHDHFGGEITDGVAAMSKQVDGVKKSPEEYWRGVFQNMLASLGKPCDRVVNQNSMGSAFTPEKQLRQVEETVERVLPGIKLSRRKWPQQELAYENCKLVLKTQNALLSSMNLRLVSAAA